MLAEIIPELNETIGFEQKNKWHIFDVLTHTSVAIDSVKEDLTLKLTMLFHDLGKPECFFVDEKGVGHFYGHPEKSEIIAKKRLKELRCSNQMLNDVCTLVKWHDIPVEPT
ncbi:MAG: HD domain-containing protein, partial [Clostridia bacterium]|nr:HD domain-containing protein [Clostridia bacterium]